MQVSGYQLEQCIGAGGMGEVYKAWHPKLQRWAAVKMLNRMEMGDRFRHEAVIQSTVNHPHIARFYETVQTPGLSCIIMEYVEGEGLDSYLRQKGPLDNTEAETLLTQVIDAIDYLHQRDIVHRDIKPANFKRHPEGKIKMLDFGIAKHKLSPKFTREGFIVGTTEYMAPEQFEQSPGKPSDIWSFGVLAYEMVTGQLPFRADNDAALQFQVRRGRYTDPVKLVPGISPKLRKLIQWALTVPVQQRKTAAACKALLEGNDQLTLFPNRKISWPVLPWKWMAAGIILVLLLALFVGGGDDHPSIPEKVVVPVQVSDQPHVRIAVPSIEAASIYFPDGTHYPLPYDLHGAEGDKKTFTIRAAGYRDKTVEVGITSRRNSYEYTLEKKTY